MADTAITINPNRVSPLSLEEQTATGFNAKFKVLYYDIAYGTGSSDTVTLTLGTTPTKWIVDKAMVNVTTAFAGTTALTITVGTTTNASAFVTSTSVLTAGAIGVAGFVPAAVTASSATSAVSMKATFTNATGGSPSALTAGALDIYLSVDNAAQLP